MIQWTLANLNIYLALCYHNDICHRIILKIAIKILDKEWLIDMCPVKSTETDSIS